MKIIGCDFHPGRQQVAVFDSGSGEIVERTLDHGSGEAERFYRGLDSPALVGMEAVGNSLWFERLVRSWAMSCGSATRPGFGPARPAGRRRTGGMRRIF